MTKAFSNQRGFTLIELVVVIIIAGILVAVAVKKIAPVADNIKTEATRQEMDLLAMAIVGNPVLENNGVRTDFGYVGDVGAMPPDLEALRTNPGSYATWKGPYIDDEFVQATNDFKKDAWDTDYIYSAGVTVTSTGSGSNIIRKLAGTTDQLLRNQVIGNLYDLDGTPPGNIYKDSLTLRLTIPNGSGGTTVRTSKPDGGGFFSFDSIPIGNHDLEIIYIPDNDTLRRFVSTIPNSELYAQYHLMIDYWTSTGGGSTGGLVYVSGTAAVKTGPCNRIEFDINNSTDSSVTITSMILSWSSPIAFYQKIKFGGPWIFDNDNPRSASGDITTFSSSQVMTSGETKTIRIDKIYDASTGGNTIAMNNVDLTVTFSDGSSFTINTGSCP